jgi:lon-related putative ATP-dependent protease
VYQLPKPLKSQDVYAICPEDFFSFKSTKDVEISQEFIAQTRAVRAIHMGLGIRRPGYNIYVAGHQGTGKTSVIQSFLEKWSAEAETPKDWVYIYNFKENQSPEAMDLPSGRGHQLARAMDEVVKDLRKEIPQVLQSEDYETAVNARMSQNSDKQARSFSELEKTAKGMNFQIKSTRMGIETIPIMDGRPLTEKEYGKLSDKDRTHIEESRGKLEPQVLEFARQVRALELDAKEYVNQTQRDMVKQVVEKVLQPVLDLFSTIETVQGYLAEVKEDILDHLLDFVEEDHQGTSGARGAEGAVLDGGAFDGLDSLKKDRFRKYKVNLFVDNRNQKGAPVVIESNPTYYNLFGKVEKNVEHGMFLTDFSMIKSGSIHKASGGYLVLEAGDVLKMPQVWDTLKRVLRNRLGFIEDMGEQYSMFPTSGLRPKPIPLDVKVILIGTNEIYHLLHELDEEFFKLFKIKSDFDFKMPRTQDNIKSYMEFVATRSHKENLLHFDRSGVCAMIEYGSRLIEDQQNLSTQFGEVKDLTIEADFIAREKGAKLIKRIHVEEAIHQKIYRVNLYENHLMDMMAQDDLLISVIGDAVGQVNGLAVYDLGDHSFGKMSRITATASLSEEGFINIERAARLSGKLHDKGMHILTAYLKSHLAHSDRFGFSVTICFEQNYGPIDGDSATIAELLAAVSALSGIPVQQSFAMTGSMNQFGQVQPIGGVNEKIEGAYQCANLLGGGKNTCSVLIPYQNVKNLMLNPVTRKAVEKKALRIYPIKTFEEAFLLATGSTFDKALELIQKRWNAVRAKKKRKIP